MFNLFTGFYLNLSIKHKILIFFYVIIIIVASVLGFNSSAISKEYVINKVSTANLAVVKQLDANINFIQKDINDISTFICINDEVQALLEMYSTTTSINSEVDIQTLNSLEYVRYIMASKSYITSFILYNADCFPIYNEFTDRSTGVKGLSDIKDSAAYKEALALNGVPLWVPMLKSDNVFVQRGGSPQIGLCRIVKSFNNNRKLGLLVMSISESTLRTLCSNNIQNANERIIITDAQGNLISHAGTEFSSTDTKNQSYFLKAQKNNQGSFIDTIGETQYLIAYGSTDTGWKTFYIVPMESLTKEISAINILTLVTVLVCLLFSFLIAAFISSYLTAPIKNLLKSMKRFQQGNFNEQVDFKYKDEIGQLGEGYNNMVKNIKELIDKAYILQIKEREAELDALQAQINPHFLYNTLDTIFWKAEKRQEKEISEMIYSLSKLFRLSLNRGMSSTLVSREKELLQHYLLLQKIRLKEKLNYEIIIDEAILNFSMPKLILQPFVENAIIHGLAQRKNGGSISVSGKLIADKLQFVISDDGVGMSKEDILKLFEPVSEDKPRDGGYAVKNVNERLKICFNDSYSLDFESEIDKGTKVVITIPALMPSEKQGGSH